MASAGSLKVVKKQGDQVQMIAPEGEYEYLWFRAYAEEQDIPHPYDSLPSAEGIRVDGTLLNGVFSISAKKRVYFSQGNLEYQAYERKWRFAREQFVANSIPYGGVTEGELGWVGTAPWDSAHAWSGNIELENSSLGHEWFLMNRSEWEYLFRHRAHADSLWGYCKINGLAAMVVLPDNWACPEGLSFTPQALTFHERSTPIGEGHNDPNEPKIKIYSKGNTNISKNNYTIAQWREMERSGAVCYLLAGYSGSKNQIYGYGSYTDHWVNTEFNDKFGYGSYISAGSFYLKAEWYRKPNYCFSIRMVRLTEDSERDSIATDLKTSGCLTHGGFSVSADKQVYFSQGNLQYKPSTDTWRFAQEQWEVCGTDNNHVTDTTSKWVDMFSFGTSGWSGGVEYYHPWQYGHSMDEMDKFYIGGDWTNSMTDANANADWGVYNAISNGGNRAGLWRTLTGKEMTYLFFNRPNASKLRACAAINGQLGIILLPDDWQQPDGVMLITSNTGNDTTCLDSFFVDNRYSDIEWRRLENSGAVFLPAGGIRSTSGTLSSFNQTVPIGFYWLSTVSGENMGYCFHFFQKKYHYVAGIGGSYRTHGLCVRLVTDSIEVLQGIENTTSVSEPAPIHQRKENQPENTMSYEPDMKYSTEGVIGGLFSVSDTSKIVFSQGNLQYRAVDGIWRFAPQQWYICGNNNKLIAPDYDDFIDLFGWGTSGYNNMARDPWSIYFYPFASDTIRNHNSTLNIWLYGPSNTPGQAVPQNSLTGKHRWYDWGTYNPISNGGNQAGLWRTFTFDELKYLLEERENAANLYRFGKIEGQFGLILLPDNFSLTEPLAASYTADQWQLMEQHGAVFLPGAGARDSHDKTHATTEGWYWTSTHSYTGSAKHLYFTQQGINWTRIESADWHGQSVRLVRDVLATTPSIEVQEDSTLYICVVRSKTNPYDAITFYERAIAPENYDTIMLAWDATSWEDTLSTKNVVMLGYPTAIKEQCPVLTNKNAFQINKNGDIAYFSPGNLQYNAAENRWRFAPQQYEMAGDSNIHISSTYAGWIDLFGFGASGYKNRYPWMTSTNAAEYSIPNRNDIEGTNYDWGMYNTIENYSPGTWRTMSNEEWNYIYTKRKNAASLRAHATVNSVYGYIFLPDQWQQPEGTSFTPGKADSYATNTYTSLQWLQMETNGAVFLPAAGYRENKIMRELTGSSIGGHYHTTSIDPNDSLRSGLFAFHPTSASVTYGRNYTGLSVRPVHDVLHDTIYYQHTYTLGDVQFPLPIVRDSFNHADVNYTVVYHDIEKGIVLQADLVLRFPKATYFTDTICEGTEGESYTWHGKTFTESIEVTDTLLNTTGCDSICTLRLTVLQHSDSVDLVSICQGESYTWHGQTFTESTEVTDTLPNAVGCDSICTLRLTVLQHSDSVEIASVCEGESYTWHGKTFTESIEVTDTLLNTAGCDSICTLMLTVLQHSDSVERVKICPEETYIWHGREFRESIDISETIVNAAGCDSICTLHLTVLPTCTYTYDTIYFCSGLNIEHDEEIAEYHINRYLPYTYVSPAQWDYMEGAVLARERDRALVDLRGMEENLYQFYVGNLTPIRSIHWSYRSEGSNSYRELESTNEPQWIETGDVALIIQFVCGQIYTSDFATEITNIPNPESSRKMIKNGILYILRGDKIYTAQGQEIEKNEDQK